MRIVGFMGNSGFISSTVFLMVMVPYYTATIEEPKALVNLVRPLHYPSTLLMQLSRNSGLASKLLRSGGHRLRPGLACVIQGKPQVL